MECLNNVLVAMGNIKEVRYAAFNNMDFSNQELKNIRFVKCNFNGADFSKSELVNVEFADCSCNNAIFNNTKLYQCKFNDSHFDKANFTNADISDFTNNKTWADIENSTFRHASFYRADVQGININNSDFEYANFLFAKLHDNTMSTSNFLGADLCSNFDFTEFNNCNLQETALGVEDCKAKGNLFVDNDKINPTVEDYIEKKDFTRGYMLAQRRNWYDTEFMNKVIDTHGSDINFLNSVVSELTDFVEDSAKESKKFFTVIEDICIKRKKFNEAFEFFDKSAEKSIDGDLDFMKKVVEVHGTNDKTINEAISAVVVYRDASPKFATMLFQETLKSQPYQKAFEKEQYKGKTVDNVR